MKITRQVVEKSARCLFYHRGGSPLEVQIELTNRCNFDCPMCPRGHLNTPVKDMPSDMFDQILGNLKGVREIILTGWGEPLVHPNFFDFVQKIKTQDKKTIVRFTTNGCLLNEDRIGRVFETDIDSVTISMDSLNEEKGAGHLLASRVSDNIRNLVRMRGASKKPEVVLQVTMADEGESDLLELVGFANEAGVDRVNLVRLITSYDPNLKRPDPATESGTIQKAKEKARAMNVELSSINAKDAVLSLLTHNDKLCLKTAYHAYITVDGEVTPCCNLRNKVMGSALATPISQIWESTLFERFFKEQEKICAGCDSLKVKQTQRRRP